MAIEKVIIENPFEPHKRKVLPITLEPGQALTSYLDGAGTEVLTILNGEVISPERRALVIPNDCDQLIISPQLTGGDGAKGIIRSIAMVALMVVAAIYAGPLAGMMTFAMFGSSAASGLAIAMVASMIMVSGSLLLNVLVPQPKIRSESTSQNYGWQGPLMTARQGLPIPKGYGVFRSAGNVVSSYVKTKGKKQWLNVLISYGFGPANSITGIKINNNPITNYKDVQYEIRLGSNTQSPVSFFSDTISERTQSTRLRSAATPFVVDGDRTDTQAIEVEFLFPKGLWAGPNSDGSYDRWIVYGKMEYKLHADSTWNAVPAPSVTADVGSTPYWIAIAQTLFNGNPIILVYATSNTAGDHYEGEIYDQITTITLYDENGDSVGTQDEHHVGTWTKNPANVSTGASPMGSTPQTVTTWTTVTWYSYDDHAIASRTVVRKDNLTPGQYDVRVSKTGTCQNLGDPLRTDTEDSSRRGEETWLTSIREIVYDDFSYPNMVLLGIRALATDQLSGGGLNVTAIVDYGPSNPSLVVQDVMTNTLYGAGIPTAMLDAPRFTEWQDLCDDLVSDGNSGTEPFASFNGVFDSTGDVWSQVGKIAATSRASLMRTGLHYTVVTDTESPRTQLFTVGNIKQDSFKETWLGLADRANSVDMAINDVTQDYETRQVTVEDALVLAEGATLRKAPTLDGFGIVSPGQAWRDLDYRLRLNKYLIRTIQFDAPVEAMACQVGDVIGVQHDLPQWGAGGKLLAVAGDGVTLTLDRIVTLAAGKFYDIIVAQPVLQIASGSSMTKDSSGLVVTLSSSITSPPPRTRLVLPDGEFEVLSIAGAVVAIAKPTTSTGAVAWQLYGIDVMEKRNITGVPATGTTDTDVVVVASAFTAAPAQYATYAFGEVLAEVKDFRVVAMTRSKDLDWTIYGVEYDPNVYGDVDPILPPAPEGGESKIQVTNLSAIEAFKPYASIPDIAVSWTPGKYTVGADVYMAEADGVVPVTLIGNIYVAELGMGIHNPSKDFWIRITYTHASGETGPSDPVKVSSDATNVDWDIVIADRGSNDPDAVAFNIYIAIVANGAAEPALGSYAKAKSATSTLGSTVTLTAIGSYGSIPVAAGTGVESLVAHVDRHHQCLIEAKSGGFYLIRVVGYDAKGMSAPYASAPTKTISILGGGGLPANVTSFRATAWTDPNATLAWDAVADPDLANYEIRYAWQTDGAQWDRAVVIFSPTASATTQATTSGVGTYFIAAINTAGRYSGIPSSLVLRPSGNTRSGGDPNPDPLPRGGGGNWQNPS